MVRWPGRAIRNLPAALAALFLAIPATTAGPIDQMEADIKALPQKTRAALIENYTWSGRQFSGFPKYRSPLKSTCPVQRRAAAR